MHSALAAAKGLWWVGALWVLHYIRVVRQNQSQQSSIQNAYDLLPLAHSSRDGDGPEVKTSRVEHALGRISYRTSSVNASMAKIAASLPQFWGTWFDFGVGFGAISMITGVVMIVGISFHVLGLGICWITNQSCEIMVDRSINQPNASWYSKYLIKSGYSSIPLVDNHDGDILVAMIPGVNMPLDSSIYYLLALFVVGLVHEAGHAIAAYSEAVRVNTFGLFVMLIYPGAFVELDQATLSLATPFRQLRIVCAGAWHNFVTGFVSWLLLASLHIWLGWGYMDTTMMGNGVVVLDVSSRSPLNTHLLPGSIITQLDETKVASLEGWENVLYERYKGEGSASDSGYCVPLRTFLTGNNECCQERESALPSANSQCFVPLEGTSQPNSNITTKINTDGVSGVCLELRSMIAEASHCNKQTPCVGPDGISNDGVCLTPRMSDSDVKIVVIHMIGNAMEGSGKGRTIAYMGDPRELWETVLVGSLVPRWSFFPLSLPYIFERFLRYTVSFSFALALLNMVPATMLDGEHALHLFSKVLRSALGTSGDGDNSRSGWFNGRRSILLSRAFRKRGQRIFVGLCTGLLGVAALASVMKALLSN